MFRVRYWVVVVLCLYTVPVQAVLVGNMRTALDTEKLRSFQDLACDHLIVHAKHYGRINDKAYVAFMEECRKLHFTLTDSVISVENQNMFDGITTKVQLVVSPELWKRNLPQNHCVVDFRLDLSSVLKVNDAGKIKFELGQTNWDVTDTQCMGTLVRKIQPL